MRADCSSSGSSSGTCTGPNCSERSCTGPNCSNGECSGSGCVDEGTDAGGEATTSPTTSPTSSCTQTKTVTDCEIACTVFTPDGDSTVTTDCYSTTCSITQGCSVEASTTTTESTDSNVCSYGPVEYDSPDDATDFGVPGVTSVVSTWATTTAPITTTAPPTTTATPTTTSFISCEDYPSDPDQGVTSGYCVCSGSTFAESLNTGVTPANSCGYTTLPTKTIAPPVQTIVTTQASICSVCTIVGQSESCASIPSCTTTPTTTTSSARPTVTGPGPVIAFYSDSSCSDLVVSYGSDEDTCILIDNATSWQITSGSSDNCGSSSKRFYAWTVYDHLDCESSHASGQGCSTSKPGGCRLCQNAGGTADAPCMAAQYALGGGL